MADRRRVFRVAEKIREIIAGELYHAADPRFSLVTITSVVVSSDLREAKIYWNVFGEKSRIEEVRDAFSAAGGMFKKCLARNLKTKFVPSLRFFYDDTLDTCEAVDKLVARVCEKAER
jgi:ribosome-binding factor A